MACYGKLGLCTRCAREVHSACILCSSFGARPALPHTSGGASRCFGLGSARIGVIKHVAFRLPPLGPMADHYVLVASGLRRASRSLQHLPSRRDPSSPTPPVTPQNPQGTAFRVGAQTSQECTFCCWGRPAQAWEHAFKINSATFCNTAINVLPCRSTATHGAMCADRTMRSQRQKFTVRILYCPTSCTIDSSSLVTAPSRKPRLTSAESPQPARQRKDVRWRLFWCQAKGCQANASHLGSGSRAWAQEDRAPAASILAESRQAARTARVAARHGSSVPPGCSDSARCRMAWELY